jgi:hypothetical protein
MLSAITLRHLRDEFRSWRMPQALTQRVPVHVLERLQNALPRAADAVPQVRGDHVEAVQGRIERLLNAVGA